MRYHSLADGPTPTWLTAVLREAGALPQGDVAAFRDWRCGELLGLPDL